jgi:selenocysteine-specific elongation factor
MTPRHAILATAGHIDHGKSALVKALTGNDPDRLPEEKLRGITIDLGFAHLELPGHSLGIVDVPGHQDFVKNMVAGVGAVDLALLVVAADDGWMPQTEEHLQILSYLGATRGVVALTKADLVDDTSAREEEIRLQLQNSPLAEASIVPVSAHNGIGLEELKNALAAAAETMPPHTDDGQPRLAVDRVFTLQGIGTVVTGTLTGGTMSKGDTVTAYPPGRDTRIRTLQSHNRAQDTAQPGTRTALNLADAARGDLPRGATITLPVLATTTRTLDVLLERSTRLGQECAPLRNDTRVRVHHGSGHWPARLVLVEGKILEPGAAQLAQLRLENPACVWPGDRIVIRNWPESATLAGGRVLDAQGDRQGLRSAAHKLFLQTRAEAPENAETWIRSQLVRDGIAQRDALLCPSTFSTAQIDSAVTSLVNAKAALAAGDWLADESRWQQAREAIANAVNAEHRAHPERPGLTIELLRPLAQKAFPSGDVFAELLKDLCQNGFKRQAKYITSLSHKPALPPNLRAAGEHIRQALAGTDPPARKLLAGTSEGAQALRFLIEAGEVVEVSPELAIGAAQFNRFRMLLKNHLRTHTQGTASELRQALGTTRRILIPLLEKMDRDGITRRQGDVRVLRDEK